MTLFPWLLGEAPWSLIYNAPKVSLDIFKTRKKLLASVGVKSLQRLSYHQRGLRHSSPGSHLPRRLLWGWGVFFPLLLTSHGNLVGAPTTGQQRNGVGQ